MLFCTCYKINTIRKQLRTWSNSFYHFFLQNDILYGYLTFQIVFLDSKHPILIIIIINKKENIAME